MPEIIAATDVAGTVYAWRQDARGLFPGWPAEIPFLEHPFQPRSVLVPPAVSDLDGDGLPEIVLVGQFGIVVVYDRFGRIRDGWPQDVSLQAITPSEFAVVPLQDGSAAIAVAIGGETPPRLTLFDAMGNSLPGWPIELTGGSFAVGGVAAGDLDGDSEPEVIVGDSNRIWAFHLDGRSAEGWPVEFDYPGNHSQPIVVDITGDQAADVLMLTVLGLQWQIGAWEFDGRSITSIRLGGSGEEALSGLTAGDLDGDGTLDLTLGVQHTVSLQAPGRVYAFGSSVPMEAQCMHWPTYAHDYARTSTWEVPTRWFGGTGEVASGRLREDLADVEVGIGLDVPVEAPLEQMSLSVTGLAGHNIPPEAVHPTSGVQQENERKRVSARVDVATLLSEFLSLNEDHPELLLNDGELRVWLNTGVAPEIPEGQERTLWLRVESPRVGVDRLKAHVPMALCQASTLSGHTVFGVGGASCDNSPPVAVAQVAPVVECTGPEGATVRLDASASGDPDSIPDGSDDIVVVEWFEDFGQPSERLLGSGTEVDVVLPVGTHHLALRVEDLFEAASTDEVIVEVTDSVSPELTVSLNPVVLWPPDHRLVSIHAEVSATDLCGAPSVVLVALESDSDGDLAGIGDNDIKDAELGAADFDFRLRAERNGASAAGRTYSVTYEAIDGAGNRVMTTATVLVPHDQRRAGQKDQECSTMAECPPR